jgi:hypothetical protein
MAIFDIKVGIMRLLRVIVLIVSALLSFGQLAEAQSIQDELELFLGESAVAQMVDNGTWEYEVFRQTQGFYTQDLNGKKNISEFENVSVLEAASSDLGVIDLNKIENGIFLAQYDIPVNNDRYGYYRIGDTGILFIVYPEVLIQKLYEQQNP